MAKKKAKPTAAEKINAAIKPALQILRPPEDITIDQWADKYRYLPPSSAEPGLWRTDRTPYLREVMRAISDPHVSKVVMVASSQVGKTEAELNAIAYFIDQDPGNILFVHPTVEDARKFSRIRIEPMIENCPRLKGKVQEVKSKARGKSKANTILQKAFPGGTLTLTGSNSASALSSTPARYIIGDERDRWAFSAGREGDPWALAEARQTTFYNAKAIEVSTPTVKGKSNIEYSFYKGTQEHYCKQCPECGEYREIVFEDVRYEPIVTKIHGKKQWEIKDGVSWVCPVCGCVSSEDTMRRQPAKWIADNPDAYDKKGIRSFWLSAFCSPWMSWEKIAIEFCEAGNDPEKLQVVFNTRLGKLWEDRGDLMDEDVLLARREDYGTRADNSPVELPDGVLLLTCAVDVQDNRLEYEVAGYGKYFESWGIKRGFIMGDPNQDEVWDRLDAVIDRVYYFKNNHGLAISITLVDSGGHCTQSVYEQCRKRQYKHVFAIKGKAGSDGIPYIRPATKVPIRDNKKITCWLYTIGVDAGKSAIMNGLKKTTPGAGYYHFPANPDAGYDATYFAGLLSEKCEEVETSSGVARWRWVKLKGHERNEPLDLRNYNNAAVKILNPDFDELARALYGLEDDRPKVESPPARKPKRTGRTVNKYYDSW